MRGFTQREKTELKWGLKRIAQDLKKRGIKRLDLPDNRK